jgi:hypothetical protein
MMTKVRKHQRWHQHHRVVFVSDVTKEMVAVQRTNLEGKRESGIWVSLDDFHKYYEFLPPLKGTLWRNTRGDGLARIMEDMGWNVKLYHVKTKRTTTLTVTSLLRSWHMIEDKNGRSLEKNAWDHLMDEAED